VADRPLPPGASLSDFQNGEVYSSAAAPGRKLNASTSGVGSGYNSGNSPPSRSKHGQIEEYRSSDGQQVHIGGSVNAGLGGFEGGNGNGNGYLLADNGNNNNNHQYGNSRGSGDGSFNDKREYIAAVAALKADRRRFQQEVQQQKRDGVDVLKLRVENDELKVAVSGHKNSLARLMAESARKVEMVRPSRGFISLSLYLTPCSMFAFMVRMLFTPCSMCAKIMKHTIGLHNLSYDGGCVYHIIFFLILHLVLLLIVFFLG
jgi:hypothetical protein